MATMSIQSLLTWYILPVAILRHLALPPVLSFVMKASLCATITRVSLSRLMDRNLVYRIPEVLPMLFIMSALLVNSDTTCNRYVTLAIVLRLVFVLYHIYSGTMGNPLVLVD